MAFNALSNHLLLVNRAVAPSINVLDAATGNNLTNLDLTGVGGQSGETFPSTWWAWRGVGAIYACNLTTTVAASRFIAGPTKIQPPKPPLRTLPDFAASERIW